jgi:parallel beta-helix repeat protein
MKGWEMKRAVTLLVVLASVLGYASTAEAATFTVAPGGDIQAAIDGAAPGDTIKLKPGRHDAAVLFDATRTGMKLVGPCDGKPAVMDALGVASETAVTIEADGVSVKCLTLQHGKGGIFAGNDGAADGTKVNRVRAFHHSEDSIKIVGDDFKVTGSRTVDTGDSGDGLKIDGDDGLIEGNVFRNTGSSCIEVTSSNGTVIRNNLLAVCDQDGVDVDAGSGLLIEDNTARDLRDVGFEITADDSTIRNNRALNTRSGGYDIDGNDVDVIENSSKGADDDDCFQVNGANVFVSKNRAGFCDSGFEVIGAAPVLLDNTASPSGDADGFRVNCTGSCELGRVERNFARAANADDEGFDITVDPGLGAGFRIRNNTSLDNAEEGFDLFVHDAIVSGNVASGNGGSDGNDGRGFRIVGNDNTISNNNSTENASFGFEINGDDNTLTGNVAKANTLDGFFIVDGETGNKLDENRAIDNFGEGIENDGTGTELTNNVARGNRTDCAGDEDAAVDTGNTCADGSVFSGGGRVDGEVD